jgi:hypothetical protein
MMGRMQERTNYTKDELEHANAAVRSQLTTFRKLAAVVDSSDRKAASALTAFEARYANDLVLALDRLFVDRARSVAGTDCNALNEVELLADSLIGNGGILRTEGDVTYVPDETVLGLESGDKIALTVALFERLSTSFLREISSKFVSPDIDS